MTQAPALKLFGVVGNPVHHSLSPKLHQFWYEQLGIDAKYVALEMSGKSPVQDIQGLARSGFSGLNVTLPHKIRALEAAVEISGAAREIQASNTLTLNTDTSGWNAHNTDWSGFLWSLDRMGKSLPNRALMIGAGGAARAVAYALKTRGIKIDILNRTVSRAEELISDLSLANSKAESIDMLSTAADGRRLIINTISLGHEGGSLDLPKTENGIFVDISYGKAAKPTLEKAKARGWTTLDGLPMLVGQAADAFEIWLGVAPDRESCLKACRKLTGTTE